MIIFDSSGSFNTEEDFDDFFEITPNNGTDFSKLDLSFLDKDTKVLPQTIKDKI